MWRISALALALLSTGCVRTETTPVIYRIPLEGNTHGAESARACAAACRAANEASESGFFACIGTCPDAEIVRDAECGPDASETPPEALCYTRLVERDVPDPAVANFLVDLLGTIAETGVRTAIHEHREGAHESRHANAQGSESHAPRHVVARPRRGS
jgi:hypothetical protein